MPRSTAIDFVKNVNEISYHGSHSFSHTFGTDHIFLPFLGTAQSRAAGFKTVAHHFCNLYKLPSLQQVIVLRIYFGRIRSSALCTCDNSARHFPLAFPRSVRKRHGHMGYRSWGLPRDTHLMKSK